MNQSTAPTGCTLAGCSGFALIVIMLLFAWFGFPNASGIDAFKAFHDWVLFFLIFTAFAGMALALVGASTRVDLPVALSAIATGLGLISLIILVIYLISPPNFSIAGLPAFRISGSTYDASAPKVALTCVICCSMPWCALSRVS